MSNSTIQHEEVFNFVMIRSPEPAPLQQEESTKPVGFTQKGPDTDFIDRLAGALREGGRTDVAKEAETFLEEGPEDVESVSVFRKGIRDLLRLYSGVYEGAEEPTPEGAVSEIERVLGDSAEEVYRKKAFHHLGEYTWNRLYALMASGNREATERERLVRAIRSFYLVKGAASSEELDSEDLKRIGELVPILPGTLFPLPKRALSESGDNADNGQQRIGEEHRKKKEKLMAELAGLYKARENLLSTHKRMLSNAFTGDTKTVEIDEKDGEVNRALVPPSGIPNVWKVSGSLLDEAGEQVVSTLENAGIGFENQSIDDVTESINDRLRDITTRLYRNGESREVFKVGNTLTVDRRGRRSLELDRLASMTVGVPGLFSLERDSSYLLNLDSDSNGDSESNLDLDLGVITNIGSSLDFGSHIDPGLIPTPGIDVDFDEILSRAVRVLGIGELNRMEQELLGYELGEIAEIMNVMKSERNETVHRSLERAEESLFEESENSVTKEKDLRRTERFEMSQEAEKTIQSESSVEAGLKVSAKYGTVKMEASAGYSSHNARSRSEKRSSEYAQEVSEKSLKRIKKRTLERRESSTLRETEETNTHAFDNTDGEHTSGIYRWVDKKYRGQVKNYGRRLMFEFIVPEPAAFYRYMQQAKGVEGVDIEKPPAIGSLTPDDIEVWNYQTLAQEYRVEGIEPPPRQFTYQSTTFKSSDTDDLQPKTSKEFEVPKGYKAVDATVRGSIFAPRESGPCNILVHVGGNTASYLSPEDDEVIVTIMDRLNIIDDHVQLGGLTGLLPVVVHPQHISEYGLSVVVRCERTEERLAEWKQDVYDEILKTYKAQMSRYMQEVEQAKADQEAGVAGNNPGRNREIEKEELKKSCIALLRRQQYTIPDAFDSPDGERPPVLDFFKADASADLIQFFEQAFEWEQMAYLFYPYFWANSGEWEELYPLEANDAQFRKFLRAGAARVVVPVEEDYKSAVLHFRETGEIWDGQDVPALDDELYISIIEEMKEDKTGPSGGQLVGEPFEYTVPTQLVKLQQSSELPGLDGSDNADDTEA